MNLKQLEYFLTIVEERQITAAAKRLHIAQPPLSHQLKLLEEELGVTLMKRGPKTIELTAEGELLRKRAEQILNLATTTVQEISNYGDDLAGTLAIGIISSSGGIFPTPQTQQFCHYYPKVRFELHEGNSFDVIEMLEKRMITFGIVRTPFQHNKVEIRYTAPEPMMAVMPENYLIGEHPEKVSLLELHQQPLIVYRRFESLIQDVFSNEKLTPFICCKNDDARTTLNWAVNGLGIGIVPKSILTNFNHPELIYKEIDTPNLYTQMGIIWQKQTELSKLEKIFLETFTNNEFKY